MTTIEERLARLEAAVFGAGRAMTRGDRLQDHEIRHQSKQWTGESAIGKWYSTAPLEWLAFHAEDHERRARWRSQQEDERTRERASWDLKTARRMRAWLEERKARGELAPSPSTLVVPSDGALRTYGTKAPSIATNVFKKQP